MNPRFTGILLISIFLLLGFATTSCRSSNEFSGFSYDPEGVTITTDKKIQRQHKRIIGVDNGNIWVSNEFSGARMNDFYQVNDSLYRIIIEPENYPINNSPWYAFKIWGDTTARINVQLSYQHGDHRYIPKLSRDGEHWQQIDSTRFRADTVNGTATLSLDLQNDTLWVSAQELYTLQDYQLWIGALQVKPWVTVDTAGYSHGHRPVFKMNITQTDRSEKRGIVIITGRQHPPEVTGALAAQAFINELASESKLATTFRNAFEVWIYPLVNPDGVQQGHWRHNAGGVDLNRDWRPFNQPETRAIRKDLLTLKNDSLRKVYYGIDFHSTDENIFYPINRDITTFPDDFTYRWIDSLKKRFPHYPIEVEPFDTTSPITKNWIHHTFGADAVTYEINDRANRDSIRTVATENARIIMHQLLNIRNDSGNVTTSASQ